MKKVSIASGMLIALCALFISLYPAKSFADVSISGLYGGISSLTPCSCSNTYNYPTSTYQYAPTYGYNNYNTGYSNTGYYNGYSNNTYNPYSNYSYGNNYYSNTLPVSISHLDYNQQLYANAGNGYDAGYNNSYYGSADDSSYYGAPSYDSNYYYNTPYYDNSYDSGYDNTNYYDNSGYYGSDYDSGYYYGY